MFAQIWPAPWLSGLRWRCWRKGGLTVSGLYLLKVMVSVVVVACLVGHGFQRSAGAGTSFGLANRVTLMRAVLVSLLLALLGEGGEPRLMWVAVAVAGLALASDALDGWLARRAGTASGFGARFDMETDAALVAVLALLAWYWERAGPWVLLAGVARYVFVLGIFCCHWMRRELPPSSRRKAVCVIALVALVVCMAPVLPAAVSQLVAGAGVCALLGSFFVDTIWLARAAHASERGVPYVE